MHCDGCGRRSKHLRLAGSRRTLRLRGRRPFYIFQLALPPTHVRADKDYALFREQLEAVDVLLRRVQVRWMQQVLTEMPGEGQRAADLGLTSPMQTDVCLIRYHLP